eukprot:6479679-Amphidinium_carterae.1
MEVFSDSSAARSFALCTVARPRKAEHVSTKLFWVQEKASRGEVLMKRVGPHKNLNEEGC